MKREIEKLKKVLKKTDDDSIRDAIKKRLDILEKRKTVCKDETNN